MKKKSLIFILLISVKIIFAQTATLRIGDVDLTNITVNGLVIVPVYVDAIDDGTVYTLQFFIGYDHNILDWNCQLLLPCVQNFHSNFPYGTTNGSWMFNDNGLELVVLWDDPANYHTMPSPPPVQKWFELLYVYKGGLAPGAVSPLVWSVFESGSINNTAKGPTEMYDQNFSQYNLTLINGSVQAPTEPYSFLNLKLFLDGPYFNYQMATSLNQLGYLPLSQPFNTSPWFYNGTEGVAAIPTTDLVDWVLVQLLTRHNGSVEYLFEVEAQTAAFLRNNGDIKALNGTNSLFFNNLDATNLYLRVYSRNHLPLISTTPLTGNYQIFNYDFSIGPDKNIGGVNVQKELSPGWWV